MAYRNIIISLTQQHSVKWSNIHPDCMFIIVRIEWERDYKEPASAISIRRQYGGNQPPLAGGFASLVGRVHPPACHCATDTK